MRRFFVNPYLFFFLILSFFGCTQKPNRSVPLKKDQELNRSNETLSDSNAIVIRMRNDDSILIENVIVPLDSVSKHLKEARKLKGKSAPVAIHVKGSTSFGTYSEVQLILERELHEFREQEALKQFEKHYDDLDKAAQTKINEMHHLRIIEYLSR